jgi:excisionase family DNA binding protein
MQQPLPAALPTPDVFEADERQMLHLHDVARELRMHPESIRRYAAEGRLRGYRVGSRWRFYRTDVDAFVKRCQWKSAAVVADEHTRHVANEIGRLANDLGARHEAYVAMQEASGVEYVPDPPTRREAGVAYRGPREVNDELRNEDGRVIVRRAS